MLRIVYFLNIAFILVFSICLESKGNDSLLFSIEHFSKEEYHAQNQNWSVDVDQEGIIYFANHAGLLEFDGISWNFFPNPSGAIMRAVTVSPDGKIFTSGYRELGYWMRDDVGILHYHSLNHLAEGYFTRNEEFWNIKVLEDRIIFHSFSSLYIYRDSSFVVLDPEGFINTIAHIGDTVYVHLRDQGLFILDDSNELVPFFIDDFFRGKLIRAMLPYDHSRILLGTASDGLFLFDGEQIKPIFPELYPFLSTNQINRGYVLDDTYIIGTILNGIIAFNKEGKVLYRINRENGLQNNTVLGIKTDRYKNIWLTLDRGIDFISFHIDPSFEAHNDLGIGAVYTGAIYNDKLYLGTNQGLFYRQLSDDDSNFSLVPATQGQVWDCRIYDGCLFVSHNTGTFLFEGDVLRKISDVSGGFSIIRNAFDPDALFQCSYSDLVVFKKRGGEWRHTHSLANFYDLIRYIELDHLNNLWASHMHRAIYKLQLNDSQDSIVNRTYYGIHSVFGKDYNIHVFKVENRIVFTTGDSLFTYDDMHDTIIPFTTLNELLGSFQQARRIIESPDHHYWFITASSIGLFHIQNSHVDLIKQYPTSLFQNQLVEGFENIFPIDSRRAYLSLENGYAILDARADDEKEIITSMNLTLSRIQVSGKEGRSENISCAGEKLVLDYGRTNLLLKYAFPKYSKSNINYHYYIEGLDNQWSDPMEKPVFELSRLPVGDYTIKAKATNDWLESSGIHELQVRVNPPWYSSTLAILVYIALIIALFVLFRNVSIARLKRVERKRREIRENQLIKLRNEKLRAELAYKSKELANSTMSIIRKNEFLLELKELLKQQKITTGDRFPNKYYQALQKKIDRNLSGGDDWKIFEAHLEKAHEPFIQKMLKKYPDLSHSDLKLCTYLRMNLSSKEIAPLLHISVRGVENHRYRLRKKMNITPNQNLTDYILSVEV